MLPFKARKFSFQTMLNDEQLKERLKTQIHTTNIFSIGKISGLYGTISNNKGIVGVRMVLTEIHSGLLQSLNGAAI